MTYEWLSNIDGGNVIGLTYIDLKKAFDTVNRYIMIQKRTTYGVAHLMTTGTGSIHTCRVSHSMFSGKMKHQNRCQSLWGAAGVYSEPLQFILYVNDFPEYVDNAVYKYADNSILHIYV